MPTVVVKNDKAVDSLRTEYTRLYSPTTTWGDIVSMNLGYPGLRGYWTMSSVDENIDVYDISGHGRTLSCLASIASPSVPPIIAISACGFPAASNVRKYIYEPWQTGQTMGSVANLTPQLLRATNVASTSGFNSIQLTTNYAFLNIDEDSPSRHKVVKYSVADGSLAATWDPDDTNYSLYNSFAYDDDIIYTLTNEWNGDDNWVIREVNITTQASQSLYTWIRNYPVYEGTDYNIDRVVMFQHFKYQSDDCVICVMVYKNNAGDPEFYYLLKVIIYHIDSGAIIDQWIEPATTFNPDLGSMWYSFAAPAFLNSKMYFPFVAATGEDWGVPPYGMHCFLPVLTIDIATDSITLNDSRKDDYDDPDMWGWDMYDEVATIDYDTNKIYWQAMDDWTGDWKLFCLDTNTDIVTIGSIIDTQESYQGADTGYGVDDDTGIGIKNIRSIPTMGIVNDVDLDFVTSTASATDIPNQMLWNMIIDKLQGRSLDGGSDRDISIAWAGGVIPFSQTTNRYVWITMLNGVMLVIVSSYKSTVPTARQVDFYLLKET